jgi:hypothetical protein
MFGCDPMTFLDRPEEDLPALLAVLDLADKRLRRSQEATHGKRR